MRPAALMLAMVLWAATATAASAQTPPAGGALPGAPVMLVVDTSGSMGEQDDNGGEKIEGAKLALLDYVGSVDDEALLGLWTYPGSTGGCDPGGQLIGVGTVNPERMSAKIRGLVADGDTPTAEAMRAAVAELDEAGYERGTLVLVSDGESTCDDPCEAAREIAGRGFELDAITVGFRISESGREQLECIANALDGRYLDVEQGDELRRTLDALGRPKLEVALGSTGPLRVVGGGDYIDVHATLTNSGDIPATGVVAQFSTGVDGVDVRRPVTHLGNVEPAASRTVNWRVRADIGLVGKTPNFSVVVRALNADQSATADGELFVEGVDEGADAGPILMKPGTIAILGDSFSSGQGSDSYDPKTDGQDNGCHRSPTKTYVVTAFPKDTTVLACSGAVTSDIETPNYDWGEDAQVDQLTAIQKPRGNSIRPARAVVMTIGGNDAGFPVLAESCIFALESCTEMIRTGLPFKPWESASRSAWERSVFGEDLSGDTLKTRLMAAYTAVNKSLNARSVYDKRGGAAPILVPGYPLPIPLSGRSCAPMGFWIYPRGVVSPKLRPQTPVGTQYWVDSAEIFFLAGFTIKLNGIVESAVREVQENEHLPVFYVDPTEMAFQPRHTLCDSGLGDSTTAPWARSLTSFNFAGLNLDQLARLVGPGNAPWENATVRQVLFGKTAVERGSEEIAHPNAKGYAAETREILRWTQSRAAATAVKVTQAAEAQDEASTSWRASNVDLGQLRPGPPITLQGGTSYPVTLDGFAPNAPLRVEVRSTPRLLGEAFADAGGRVSTRVALPPDLEDGAHELVISGAGAGQQAKVTRIAFEYDAPLRLTFVGAALGGGAVSLALGLLLLGVSALLSRWAARVSEA